MHNSSKDDWSKLCYKSVNYSFTLSDQLELHKKPRNVYLITFTREVVKKLSIAFKMRDGSAVWEIFIFKMLFGIFAWNFCIFAKLGMFTLGKFQAASYR